jgi:hypothetical protein
MAIDPTFPIPGQLAIKSGFSSLGFLRSMIPNFSSSFSDASPDYSSHSFLG